MLHYTKKATEQLTESLEFYFLFLASLKFCFQIHFFVIDTKQYLFKWTGYDKRDVKIIGIVPFFLAKLKEITVLLKSGDTPRTSLEKFAP